MSNLIPHQQHKSILNDYRARYVLAGSFLAMGAAFFSLLVLAPSFGVLLVTRPAAAKEASQAQQNSSEATDLARAQSLIVQASPIVSASSSIMRTIAGITDSRPAGVLIDSVSYNAGSVQTIVLGGLASNRLVLDQYRTALQANKTFSSVKLPVGELVSFKGGRFTITIEGKF